jgi:transmembrane sensor
MTTAMPTPGEHQTSVNSKTPISVETVHLDKVMTWKNGYVLFGYNDTHAIKKQAARWYDVADVYHRELDERIYGRKLSENKDFTELLKNFELTGTIHFNVEGRRVTVMQ